MAYYLLENTVTGERQALVTPPIEPLAANEVSRGLIPAAIPPHLAIWDGAAIVADPTPLRQQFRARVKALREQHETGGLATPYGSVETDAESQRKIIGAVVMAMLGGAGFSIDWRMANDAIATLNATDMSNLGVLVGQHVSACQYRKNELDDEIAEAAGVAALEAIDITAGWPG